MALPLLERTALSDPRFVILGEPGAAVPAKPQAGQQYRFHFDMTRCIGCKCCEVACNEQNNNPAHINWRRVGEIEAGSYPFTQRFHLSMGCNHCLDAACLKGCPVDAYTKDAATGIVLHSADACIGCQYCTWNCPYGVPQFNAERGVVGKCDLCYHRLEDSLDPACVNACPEQAIRVEIVDTAEWRSTYAGHANAPGMPPADSTISTTRITLPARLNTGFQKADYHRVRPEHPHWPLVIMLVLTQMSVGAFAALFLTGKPSPETAIAALLVGMLALGASTAHLGRPAYAYRALKMWRRSWLSREVLSFSLFAGAASAFAASLLLGLPFAPAAGAATVATGLLGILSSACIYLVPARPAWNSWTTLAEFFLTAALLGPVLAQDTSLAPGAAAAILLVSACKFFRLSRSAEFELSHSALLCKTDLRRLFLLRFALLASGAFLPAPAALPFLLAAEILGRYLFFVSVVPRNIANSFFRGNEGR